MGGSTKCVEWLVREDIWSSYGQKQALPPLLEPFFFFLLQEPIITSKFKANIFTIQLR